MEHYSDRQWMLLQKGRLDTATAALLRDHLRICPTCQQRYLKLINPRQEELADQLVPIDFTSKVMAKIAELPPLETSLLAKAGSKRSKIAKNFWQQMGAYAVAVGLTIVLMVTGIFDHLTVWPKERFNLPFVKNTLMSQQQVSLSSVPLSKLSFNQLLSEAHQPLDIPPLKDVMLRRSDDAPKE
ncbi:MAG: hypothetical protein GX489_03780 [Firmicutes bacterium]|jgi:hypothetical protein|nr:hypothetical protein [Bacillota bacterium]